MHNQWYDISCDTLYFSPYFIFIIYFHGQYVQNIVIYISIPQLNISNWKRFHMKEKGSGRHSPGPI